MRLPHPLYGLYERRLAASLAPDQVPRHVGVILDGNRRWAKSYGESAATGHRRGAGKILELKAKEYSLLVFLIRHPNQVLSRTRIYEHVWDERYDGLSNTLEVHVFELRRRLEAHGDRLIHTLRGRGYSFGDPPGSSSGEGA